MLTGQTDLATVITGVLFRTKDDREGDSSKTIEIGCAVPLTPELAFLALPGGRMRDELYHEAFTTGGPAVTEWIPKRDITDVGFTIPATTQLRVALATAPGGAKPKAVLTTATVKHLCAEQGEDHTWTLTFRLVAPLVSARDAVPFIEALKETVWLAITDEAPTLDYDTALPTDVAPGVTVTVDPDGTVAAVTPTPPKARGRRPRLVKPNGAAADTLPTAATE